VIGSRRRTPATNVIFVAILIGFAIEVLTGAWTDGERLARLGAIVPEWIRAGQYWRLLTALFLHGDGTAGGTVLHLGMNLLALYQLGSLYELMFGTRRFVLIYFTAGIAASLTSFMHIQGASVGASGAIFGILGAFVFSVLRSPRFRHEKAARNLVGQCVFWIVANIVIGLSAPQIDNAAHIGGLVTGLLLGYLLPHRTPPPPPNRVTIDVMPYDGG
jgi:rhomboid protease GluP